MFPLRACLLSVAAAMAALSCGEDTTGPTPGSLEISSVTTGDPSDPDGYLLTLDGEGRTIETNASLTVPEVNPGDHELELGGIAGNCVLQGSNPRTVTVTAGLPAQTTFQVDCAPYAGSIQVTVHTSGESPDPDGYAIALDGGAGRPIDGSQSVELTAVAPGDHSLRLTGLAPNCAVQGENPQTVRVDAGPVQAVFEVGCGPAVGNIFVTATTAGPRPDLDGYLVSLDGGPPEALPSNGGIAFGNLPLGDHQLLLTGVAGNCAVEADNPRTAMVTNGGSSPVAFQVNCHATGAGMLLFTSDRSGNAHVYRLKPDGSGIADLTPESEGEDADWSPDRTRIAFSTSRDGDQAVYIMDADGSNPRRLAEGVAPSWSPDGRQIAFVSSGEITVMNADGSNPRTLAPGAAPSWSPDGGRIAFQRRNPNRCALIFFDPICATEIYVMEADGSLPQRLTSSTSPGDQAGAPAWSPDGAKIAYQRRCCFPLGSGENGIWVVNSAGGSPTQIRTGAASTPIWSPDGSAIAFAASLTNGTSELTVIPSTGGPGVVLASSPASEYPSSWK